MRQVDFLKNQYNNNNKFVLGNTKENCIPKVHHETLTVCFKVPQKEQFVLFRVCYQNLLINSVLSQMKTSLKL